MPRRSPDRICSGRECPKVYFSFNLPRLKSGPCARDNTFNIAIHQWMTIVAINILLLELQLQRQVNFDSSINQPDTTSLSL